MGDDEAGTGGGIGDMNEAEAAFGSEGVNGG